MKILVTGSNGFIGKNLIFELKNRNYNDILMFDKETKMSLLDEYTKQCEFVFHLAGVNRPKDEKEFIDGNYGFTTILLNKLKENNNHAPVLITSSVQATLDNLYGKSKKAAEDFLFEYEKETGSKALVYRLPNVFGKWCRPNYNSAIATFCYNISHSLDITVNDSSVVMNLVYIDDVVSEFINALENKQNQIDQYCYVPTEHKITLGKIAELIKTFKDSRDTLEVPDMSDEFTRKLYSTYLSYLPKDDFSYPLKMNIDNRGSFTELIRTPDRGQVSVNISKPGITKGNHWHHTKNEKFLVVKGEGLIKFRNLDSDEIIEYHVSENRLEVVDIPPGYTHNIINVGNSDMITIMWSNDVFNPEKPDTYYLEV